MVIETLREQWARVAELDKEIGVIERRIKLWHRGNAASQQIAEIPGVGVLSATAVVAAMGDPAAFRSGREFAAWLGLVPRHSGTGGRVRMLGISKRGDRYLRTLLIHGARAVLTRSKAPPEWALRLAERRPAERGHCRDSQQDSTHDLGLVGPRPGVSTELRQPASLSAATTGTRTNTGGGR